MPFTALAISSTGRVIKFSKQGIVEDPPNAPSK
jgi:hypothetical protein